jgi:hypothetical protein
MYLDGPADLGPFPPSLRLEKQHADRGPYAITCVEGYQKPQNEGQVVGTRMVPTQPSSDQWRRMKKTRTVSDTGLGGISVSFIMMIAYKMCTRHIVSCFAC